jgi:iron(III) transport system substrate-binding protein
MTRNTAILAIAAVIVALPFVFRRPPETAGWKPGDPVLVIVSPHNEAIRHEFGQAFSAWHRERYGRPVKVDWRNIGGTTEIMRYLAGEYVSAFRAWWLQQGRPWRAGIGDAILDRKFDMDKPPAAAAADQAARAAWEVRRDAWKAFRGTDDPSAFSCRIDLFFGGGSYDHGKAAGQGLAVAPWPDGKVPAGILAAADGAVLIPEEMSGETWRTATFFGNALSTFGICYNVDRLRHLHVAAPRRWEDLAAPAYFRQLGVADPTKSGSIAKAFEMIVQEQCHRAVLAAGFSDGQVRVYEAAIGNAKLPPGQVPPSVPAAYQAAVEAGWLDGVRLIRRIGANARYFTDSASKVPIDVSVGDAAAGIAIDFYGRYQAESARGPGGEDRMVYITPAGGSSVSADPISLLRGAEHREPAVRFIEFVMTDGQKLWNYRPGTPGGPRTYALRRLPVRRDFYPSDDPVMAAAFREHSAHTADALGDPDVNPYALAGQFTYQPRWTGGHFGILRDLVRAMCMDSGDELRAAWQAIIAHGGPEAQPEAMAAMERLPAQPPALTWLEALEVPRTFQPLDYMRTWTVFFRGNYREARARVRERARDIEGTLNRQSSSTLRRTGVVAKGK